MSDNKEKEEERGLIIVFGSEKGGPGKSTCATNCAAEFSRLGYKTLLIDADKQRTSANWSERRYSSIDEGQESWPKVHCIEKLGKVKNTVLEQAKHYDVVIVDSAGRDSAELRSALLAADLLYIPTQASQFDLETMDDMASILEEIEEHNPPLQAFTLITQVPTTFGSLEFKEASNFLKDSFSKIMPLARSVIRSRKAFRVAPRNGASVIEWSDNSAKAEIQVLVQEIIKHA